MLKLIATSTTGLETVVSNELKSLGYMPHNSAQEVGRTFFQGEFYDLIRTNLWLRSAGKILVNLAEFDVSNDFDVIFDAVREIEWENWAPRDAAFIVEGRSVRSTITSVPALQRTVKKAIVTRLSSIWNIRTLPETGPKYEVEISLFKDRATITLNTSGRGLHRRGYRLMNVTAPLRETLAAALVKLSVWRPGRPFLDPFCGSGTIPIEAALIGRNIAPGLHRSFDAENWPVIPKHQWLECREEARAQIRPSLPEKLVGSDINEECIKLARRHAQLAGVEKDIVFSCRDFYEIKDDREYGCVICNPPYGTRIGETSQLRPLYESIPAVLSKFPTWSHYIFTNWLDFNDVIGQEATRKRKLYNGRLECVYYQYLGPQPPKSFWERIDSLKETNTFDSACSDFSEYQRPSIEGDAISSTASESLTQNNVNSGPSESKQNAMIIGIGNNSFKPVFSGLDEYAFRQAEEFGRCLTNRARHLRRYPSRGITCYRLYDKDLPEVPLAIDIFEGQWLHIAEYERPDNRTTGQHRLWLDKMVSKAGEVLGIPSTNIFVKRRSRQSGKTQYEKFDDSGRTIHVKEGGLSFICNMTDYLDVGLFLDHRQTRDMVRREAYGKRFLNLFCYSGSFTCYAADGGATSTVSVDLSPTYLDWCEANLNENGLMHYDGKQERKCNNQFVKSDVLRFLKAIPHASDRNKDIVRLIEETANGIDNTTRRAHYAKSNNLSSRKKYFKYHEEDKHERGRLPQFAFGVHQSDFDLCVCDPPTFSNSKSTDSDWDVQRRHVELLRILATRMKPGGVVYFSNNYRKFKLNEENLIDLYDMREITNRTIPDDFRNKRIHRCWRLIAR